MKIKAIIGNEITYRDYYAETGISSGKVIGRLDHTIIILEIVENGIVRNKLIDESQIEKS